MRFSLLPDLTGVKSHYDFISTSLSIGELNHSSELHCRQISLIEHNQPNDTQNQACDYQHPWIPPGKLMIHKCIYGWSVVKWPDLEHPAYFVCELADRVDQVGQSNEAHGCSTGSTTGIHK